MSIKSYHDNFQGTKAGFLYVLSEMKIKLFIISLVLAILCIFAFFPDMRPSAIADGQSDSQASNKEDENRGKQAKEPDNEGVKETGKAKTSDDQAQDREDEDGGNEGDTAEGDSEQTSESGSDENGYIDSEDEDKAQLDDIRDEIEFVGEQFYKEYAELLDNYVDENGNVDYLTLRRHRIDIYSISRILDSLHQAEYLSWKRNQKIAFWINAYNLFTIRLVIENYPIEPKWYNKIVYPDNSIIQISGAWDRHYFTVMGLEYSLKEIEREILLEKFTNPKIFFALSYATMGGAYLRDEPYRGEMLDEQLTEQVRKFLSSDRAVQFEPGNDILRLSDIFNWYSKAFSEYEKIKRFRTFKPKERAYLNFIYEYGNKEVRDYLKNRDFEIRYIRYDWRLNEQSK